MAKPQRVTFFKTSLEDKPGTMLATAQRLKSRNLNLSALWGYSTRDGRSDLFVIPKNAEKLRAAWQADGMSIEEGTAFFVKGTDKVGALVKTLEALSQAGVNIIAMNAVAVSGNFGSMLWVAPGDVEKAAAALGSK